jgi:hypothetical protein
MLSQINYQEKSDKTWNVKGNITSHIFHYLQFFLLLDSSKLARTRTVLAAGLYWVKMTEPITKANKRNKATTSNYNVIAYPLNRHFLSPSAKLRMLNREFS